MCNLASVVANGYIKSKVKQDRQRNTSVSVMDYLYNNVITSASINDAIEDCVDRYGYGKVVIPKQSYRIELSKYVNVPVGIELDGGWNEFRPTTEPDLKDNFMFGMNRDYASGNWDSAYNHDGCKIRNIKLYTRSELIGETVKGVYVCSTSSEINGIFTSGLDRAIEADTNYKDLITIDNAYIIMENMEYGIYIPSLGDGLNISRVHFNVGNDIETGTLRNGIYVKNCAGGKISKIINGSITLENSKAVGLENLHMERGILTFNSVDGCYVKGAIFQNPDHPDGQIVCYTSDDESFRRYPNVSFEDIVFNDEYDSYHRPSTDVCDIKITDGCYTIKNCYRKLDKYKYGIKLKSVKNGVTSWFTEFNNYSGVLSNFSVIQHYEIKSRISATLKYDTYTMTVASDDNSILWNGTPDTTYYYKANVFLDPSRRAGRPSNEVSKAVVDKAVRISVVDMEGAYVRMYRGTATGVYTHYADIPVCSASALIDMGNDISGFIWNTIGGETTNIHGCRNFEIGNNRALSYSAGAPSVGTWAKDDIVYNNGLVAGGSLGWICITAGTPGTWKTLPNIGA